MKVFQHDMLTGAEIVIGTDDKQNWVLKTTVNKIDEIHHYYEKSKNERTKQGKLELFPENTQQPILFSKSNRRLHDRVRQMGDFQKDL